MLTLGENSLHTEEHTIVGEAMTFSKYGKGTTVGRIGVIAFGGEAGKAAL